MTSFNSAFEKPRPPYIRFEKRPIERRDAAGNVTYVDIDYALITQPGGKDTIEKIWKEWFPYVEGLARQGAYPAEWIPIFREAYGAWERGQTAPVRGTPVTNWPAATPAEVKMLTMLGILAVEDVAEMNEEVIARVGMGARALRQKAKDWVAAKEDASLVNQLSAKQAEIDRANVRISELEVALKAVTSRLDSMQSAPAAGLQALVQQRGRLEERLANEQAKLGPAPRDEDDINDAIGEVLG